MPDFREQIESEVTRLRTSVQQFHDLINGDASATVELEKGPQPAFKKYVADRFDGIMESYRGEMDSQLDSEVLKITQALDEATRAMDTLRQQLDTATSQTPVTVAYVDSAVKAVADAVTALEQRPIADVNKAYVDEAVLALNDSLVSLEATISSLSTGGVEDIRLGTATWIDADNRSLISSASHVFTQLHMDDGRVNAAWLQPLQKKINGQWLTVSSVW